ncbi:MAG TPA: hypothetical protein VF132_06500 [Rudaea sp.]
MAAVLVAFGCAFATETPPGDSDTAHSASLAGVKRWEDATPADLSADATYLLPGYIDGDITFDNLRRRFGAKNVREADIDGAEGETAKGIVLFADDPLRRVELFIRDEKRHRGISEIRVTGERSRWHFANGLKLGMTLDALAALNGKPVTYSGLDWDYGGAISDWNGGRLAQRDEEFPARSVSLNHRESASGYPIGEGDYLSDDKKYPNAGKVLFVGELRVAFKGDDD